MEPAEVDSIVFGLPKGRTPFSYFRDRYAFLLLSYAVGTRLTLHALKRTRFQKLTEKPAVRRALASAGSGVVTHDLFAEWEAAPCETYALTLGRWGCRSAQSWSAWYQTSRPGQNLVLQLNFPDGHDRAYERLLRVRGDHPFVVRRHPARADNCLTLAWARLDIDLHAGEAIIEELQSDWVRYAAALKADIEQWIADGEPAYLCPWSNLDAGAFEILTYIERVLLPLSALWSQAMLSAAIWFLREELMIHRIFLHTWESTLEYKKFTADYAPPRSLYSTLPEQFCFERTASTPEALRRSDHPKVRAAVERKAPWYVLEL